MAASVAMGLAKAFPLRDGSPARHAASPCICHSAGLGKPSSVAPWPGCEPFHSQPDGARPPLTQRHRQLNVPANSRQSGPRASLAVSYPAISLTTATVSCHRRPPKRLQTVANLPSTRIRARTIASVTSSPPFQCPHAVHPCPSVDSGLGMAPPEQTIFEPVSPG